MDVFKIVDYKNTLYFIRKKDESSLEQISETSTPALL
jgi:hypothetical protein